MTLRLRILAGAALLVLLPLALLGQLVSQWIEGRFTRQYHDRIQGLVEVVAEDVAARDRFVADRLAALRTELLDDNRFRVGLEGADPAAAEALRDRAVRSMHLLGLDMLQFQTPDGEILSCGHFWNMYGSRQERLVPLLRTVEGPGVMGVLAEAPRQEGSFLAQVRLDSLRIGAHTMYLIGGIEFGPTYVHSVTRDPDLMIRLRLPEGLLSGREMGELEGFTGEPASGDARDGRAGAPAIVRSLELPLLVQMADTYRPTSCAIELRYPLAPLEQLLGGFRQWLLIIMAVLALGSLLLAVWLSRQISRPLADLAEQTRGIDLETLDTRFASRRDDEVGLLTRVLDQMMSRLRSGAQRLREVERRATLGEMARQVNHDIKNGLIPIRNVLRHLTDLLGTDPAQVPRVLSERRAVLEASIAYLEDLAANYARISTRPGRRRCRCNEVIEQAALSMGAAPRVKVDLDLDPRVGEIAVDPVALRRITENLMRNAAESLRGQPGDIRVVTRPQEGQSGEPGVVIEVRDEGPGISEDVLPRIFDDFFTTKPEGSGLGLSIVRRLVSDFDGTIHAENLPGRGACFRIWLPRDQGVGE